MQQSNLTLGSGLIRIGRPWGASGRPVPTEKQALEFLETAFSLGIRFFDTAPSYGLSEQRLGKFLQSLTESERKTSTIATKFGEHWDFEKNEPYTDHSYEALVESIDKSISLLGKIDVLQLHKSSPELLMNEGVNKAFEYAKKKGVKSFGASVSDLKTGILVCEDNRLEYIQLPYNEERTELRPVIDLADQKNKQILFNRPFTMGSAVSGLVNEGKENKIMNAFSFILKTNSSGVILSGTASAKHLKENIGLFNKTK